MFNIFNTETKITTGCLLHIWVHLLHYLNWSSKTTYFIDQHDGRRSGFRQYHRPRKSFLLTTINYDLLHCRHSHLRDYFFFWGSQITDQHLNLTSSIFSGKELSSLNHFCENTSCRPNVHFRIVGRKSKEQFWSPVPSCHHILLKRKRVKRR